MPLLSPQDMQPAIGAGATGLLNSYQTGFQSAVQDQQLQLQLNIAKQLQQDAAQVAQNPTPSNIAALSIKYPQLSEQFKRSYDMMTTEQQTAKLNQAIPIYAAVQNGQADTAAQLLEKQADGYDNAGQPQNAAQARAMAQFVRNHPDAAKSTMGVLLAGVLGPDKFRETFATVGTERRAEEKQPAEVQKLQGEAAQQQAAGVAAPTKQAAEVGKLQAETQDIAQRMGLEQDKLKQAKELKLEELRQQYGGLPPQARFKVIGDSAENSVRAQQSAERMEDIANRFEAENTGSSGAMGRWREDLKSWWGSEDAVTALKAEFTRLKNNGMLANMRSAGIQRITNFDMQVLSKGFPEANADPNYVASFMRSMATLQRVEQLTEDLKSQWVYQNGHPGPAKADMDIGGVKIAKGSTLQQATQQYLKSQLPTVAKQQNVNTIQNRSYMQFANPPQQQQPGQLQPINP